jgi:hypothetical protein
MYKHHDLTSFKSMSYGAVLKFCGVVEADLRPLTLPICRSCTRYIFESRFHPDTHEPIKETRCGNKACKEPRPKGAGMEPLFQYFDLHKMLKGIVDDPFYQKHLGYAYEKISEKYGGKGADAILEEPDFYYDFYDGSKARQMFAKHGVEAFRDVLFFSMVTDGISLSRRANNSVIPIILRLHNLPPWLRAKFLGSFMFGIVPAASSSSNDDEDDDEGTERLHAYDHDSCFILIVSVKNTLCKKYQYP